MTSPCSARLITHPLPRQPVFPPPAKQEPTRSARSPDQASRTRPVLHVAWGTRARPSGPKAPGSAPHRDRTAWSTRPPARTRPAPIGAPRGSGRRARFTSFSRWWSVRPPSGMSALLSAANIPVPSEVAVEATVLPVQPPLLLLLRCRHSATSLGRGDVTRPSSRSRGADLIGITARNSSLLPQRGVGPRTKPSPHRTWRYGLDA